MRTLVDHRLNVWLKARQLGMTWLALAFVLWTVLRRPGVTVMVYSRRDMDAIELLRRIKGMAARLPEVMRPKATTDSDHVWQLGNGARVIAFPTTAGDSYTAALVVIDEADLVPNLDSLMGAVKPTIDAGGSMLLLSRADKSKPNSLFKRTYIAAKAGASPWHATFLPWFARPGRDAAWYAEQERDIVSRTGSRDRLREQYPATDDEALAPNQLDKRILSEWIAAVSKIRVALTRGEAQPNVAGLWVFDPPTGERRYAIGADPAEGNPNSDDSAASIIDVDTGMQVAVLRGKIEPTTFAASIAEVSRYYHGAACLCERNNHGHAVIAALREHDVHCLKGHDGKEGWLSSGKGKVLLYDACCESIRDGEVTISDFYTQTQLAAIEGGTLRAPDGDHDDLADAFALACCAMRDPAVKRRPISITGRR